MANKFDKNKKDHQTVHTTLKKNNYVNKNKKDHQPVQKIKKKKFKLLVI